MHDPISLSFSDMIRSTTLKVKSLCGTSLPLSLVHVQQPRDWLSGSMYSQITFHSLDCILVGLLVNSLARWLGLVAIAVGLDASPASCRILG